MLMRIFDTSDYDRSLRRRRLLALGLLAVGLTGLACYILLIHNSGVLPDYARGFYLGAASGISIGAVILLIRMQYLLTHPEARKKAKIQEQDEREGVPIRQDVHLLRRRGLHVCAGGGEPHGGSGGVWRHRGIRCHLADCQPLPVQENVRKGYFVMETIAAVIAVLLCGVSAAVLSKRKK